MQELLKIIGENWFTNVLGMVGGILGIWAFVDSYLIRFVPKIYIGTKVIIDSLKDSHSRHTISSLICSLEICNHRKRYGVIYDFALRVYKADEINSDAAVYYASQMVNKIPINIDDLKDQEYELFNPITVLPESNSSVNIVLGEVLFRSKMNVSTHSNYYIEAYYQKKPEGKWYFINKQYLYNDKNFNDPETRYLQFSVLSKSGTREKLNKDIKQQKTNLYNGISHKHLSNRWSGYRYNISKIIQRFKDGFYTIPFYTNLLIVFLIDKFVRIPIIKKGGKKIEKLNVRFENEANPITEDAFNKIFIHLKELILEINKEATPEAIISLEEKDKYIILQRHKLAIKFYKSGNRSITVQDVNAQFGSRLSYNITLEKAIFGKSYWRLKNYGFITIKSFSIKVLDAFILHSCY